jgi:hypothetical protein
MADQKQSEPYVGIVPADKICWLGAESVAHLLYLLLTDDVTYNAWKDLYSRGVAVGEHSLRRRLNELEVSRRRIYGITDNPEKY